MMRITKYAAVMAAAGALLLTACASGSPNETGDDAAPAPAEDVSFDEGTTMARSPSARSTINRSSAS
jgi:glutamate transport system substrate-binding protein